MRVAPKVALLILLVSMSVAAQKPTQDPTTVSSEWAAEKLKNETLIARIEALQRQIAQQKGQVADAEGRLSAEKGASATLAISVVDIAGRLNAAQKKIEDLKLDIAARDATIDIRTNERDRARAEAKHSRSWGASFKRVFFGIKATK